MRGRDVRQAIVVVLLAAAWPVLSVALDAGRGLCGSEGACVALEGSVYGEANHMYRAECAHCAPHGWNAKCMKYERLDCHFAAAMNRTRYPWGRRVRPAEGGCGRVLYGTGYAQKVIWKHQNPSDCSTAHFAQLAENPTGLGAMLHLLGRALGLAFELGRILVVIPSEGDRSENPWFDEAFCPGHDSWECWFLPLSRCRPVGPVETLTWQMLFRDTADDPFSAPFIQQLDTPFANDFTSQFVPRIFRHMLATCSNLKDEMWHYWWLAQAVTFIVRFNPKTRQALDAMRRTLRVRSVGGRADRAVGELPAGAVSAHVRHGDKGAEMALLPFAQYLEQAERLAEGDQKLRVLSPHFADSNRNFSFEASEFSGRALFVSTEDPSVIREARGLSRLGGRTGRSAWHVFWTLANRTNADVLTMVKAWGSGWATLHSLANLELALEADAWVCTLFSNWCMLIDELRMTVGAKAAKPFVNLVRRGYRRGEGCSSFSEMHPRCYTNM